MKLTVISPCYNEVRCIRGWLENCRQFADEVVVSEGGSADGTRAILDWYAARFPGWLRVMEHRQEPGSAFWRQPERRRALVEAVSEGWIVALDVDEMLPDDFRAIAAEHLRDGAMFEMRWWNFWRSPNFIRVGTPDDPHWGPTWKWRVFPAGKVGVGDQEHHTPWICDLPKLLLPGGDIFHYHYLFADRKSYENHAELWTAPVGPSPEIPIRHVAIRHPDALRFLTETVNFGDLVQTGEEQEAGSGERGARSMERGAGSEEHGAANNAVAPCPLPLAESKE